MDITAVFGGIIIALNLYLIRETTNLRDRIAHIEGVLSVLQTALLEKR